MRAPAVASLVALCLALPAAAQAPRAPDERQTLLELAYVLGEAHALRTACAGSEDQAWRVRMSAVLEVEQPEDAFRRRMVERFNAGYVARQADTPACGPGTAAEERAAAARGGDLARRLAR